MSLFRRNRTSKEVDLGEDPIGSLLANLAIPAVASQLVNALYNIVDRIYIGNIPGDGALALTGMGVAFPIILLVSAFAALVGAGGGPRAGIFMGKGDYDGANKVMGNAFTALTVVALLLTAILLLFKEPILYLFGASSATIGYAKDYISVYALGTTFVLWTLGLNIFIAAQGFSKVSMMTVVIGAVINIILDPIFIFVFGFGVQGAAIATVISQGISAIWCIHFLRGDRTHLTLDPKYMPIEKDILLPTVALGVAPFFMQGTESVLNLAFNRSLLAYGGDLAVGAMTILASIMQFSILPLVGITQGGQPIISYNLGAWKMDRVKEAFKIQTIACVIYTTAFWLIAQFFPETLVRVFTADPELTKLAAWALKIYLGALLLLGVQISCQQTFIALGNAKTSAFLAIFRKIILLIPFIYIFPQIFEDQVFAVFFAEPVADVIAVFTTVILFRREMKRLMDRYRSETVASH